MAGRPICGGRSPAFGQQLGAESRLGSFWPTIRLGTSDLGTWPTLETVLLGNDPDRAAAAMVDLGRAVGRLHGATLGRRTDYEAGLAAFGCADVTTGAGGGTRGTRRWEVVERACQDLALPDARNARADMAYVRSQLDAPGNYAALVHDDLNPTNVLVTDRGVRLVDFEGSGYGHIGFDVSFLHYPFPHHSANWSVLPEPIIQVADRAYRETLTAEDLHGYDGMLAVGAAAALAGRVVRLPLIASDDQTSHDSWRRRAQLVQQIGVFAAWRTGPASCPTWPGGLGTLLTPWQHAGPTPLHHRRGCSALSLVRGLAWTGRVRETPVMAAEFVGTEELRGGRIHLCELGGLEIRDCEVSGLRIVDCYGSDVDISGDFGRIIVNDIDVTAYVEAELDKQQPARVLAREAASPDDYRAAWDLVETQWAATLDRARLLPEAKLHEQVNGEWSFVETHRHLLFASDAWLGNAVLEEDAPYHPYGYTSGGMPAEESAKLGLTLDATPTLDEVLALRRNRMAVMRRVVDGLTESELDRICARKPAEPYPDQEYVVRRCLKVILKEEAEHHRYAVRDLAVLEAAD